MIREKLIASLAIGVGTITVLPSSISAANTPYETVLIATAVNYCASEYGLITRKKAYEMVINWVKDEHNLEPYQVYNLMARENLSKDSSKLISKMGGCKAIAASIKKRLKSVPTGIQGVFSRKKRYKYFYNVQ